VTVTESTPTEDARIGGAVVEIAGGPHDRQTCTTSGDGTCRFDNVRGGFNIRATREGYDVAVAMVAETGSAGTIRMPPSMRILDDMLTGAASGGSPVCGTGSIAKPCAAFDIPIHHNGVLGAVLTWSSGSNDLDLELYRGTTRLASSSTATRTEESISTQVSPGLYQLRVVYYQGSTVQNFQVRVNRPN
jgi:hypothetical protein